MADEEFLKKVYDKYLGSDYEWGDADLNPKREIRKSDEEQWEEEQAAILEAIENRLKELQAQAAKLPKYKKPEVVDNDDFKVNISGMNGGPSPSDDTSMEQFAMQAALGGDIGDNLFIPQGNFDDQINFMLNTVIPQLIPVLVQGPFYPDTTPGGPGLSVEMFNPGCDTEDETADDFVSSNPEFNKLKKELEAELGDDRGDDEEDDDNGGAGGSGGAADQADKDAEKADAAAEKAIAARNKEVADCIAKELGILQAILAILKVINMLKKILLLIMSILVPLVKMIAFAAQCWINPPAAGEVIQMVAEKISALLISAIGEIIQMIWDLLDMDCKTEQVMKVLDEINEVLAGVDSAVNMTKNLISFGMKAYEENAASLQDSFDKFRDPANAKKWKDAIGEFADKDVWKENGVDTFKDAFTGGETGTAAIKNIISTVVPSNIKDALNSVIDSAKGILNTAKDLVDDTGLQDSVLKATLVDMTDFLGPISIK